MKTLTLPAFSEAELRDQLGLLDESRRLAFGAACCERLLPCFLKFSDEVNWNHNGELRDALSLIWRIVVKSEESTRAQVASAIAACEAIVPSSDESSSLYVSSAQDAVFATCALLDHVLHNDFGKLVLAARYPIDSLDLLIQELEGLVPGTSSLEASILSNPLMQQELRRQRRDLEALAASESALGSPVFQNATRRELVIVLSSGV